MLSVSVVVMSIAGILSSLLYVYVGRLAMQRPLEGDARFAMRMFATWWFSLGLITFAGAARLLMIGFDVVDLNAHLALSTIMTLPFVIALWSLLYYLLYLYIGKRSILAPLTAVYAGVYGYFIYLTYSLDPQAVIIDNYAASFEYANQLDGSHLVAVLVLLLGPVVLAAGLYGSLIFRLESRVHRYRVALVSGSFLVWFGGLPVFGILTDLGDTPEWAIMSRVFSFIVPLIIVMAYRPPARIQAWLESGAETPAAT